MKLDEFVESEDNRRQRWVDTLPQEIQDQILDSSVGAAQITRWLINLGYSDATQRKIDPLIEQRRRNRG
tara:strand:- start:647 stop:853 length:207 start_codon:yes stop_codon:yes gene_type:complete